MTTWRPRALAVAVLAALTLAPVAALAVEHEDDSTEDGERRLAAVVDAYFDEARRLLTFSITTPDAEAIDCAVPDDVVLERSEDSQSGDDDFTVVEGEWDVPEGCQVVDVAGPNGQVNHGQVVSNFVHALKALDRSAFDVPFGQLVRQIASSDFGKKAADDDADDADEDAADDDDASTESDDDAKGPPPHANNDKDKAPKTGKGNNGKGWGANK